MINFKINPMAESLYIHIPFCLRKCFYCDFTSIVYGEDAAKSYLTALKKETQLRGKMKLNTLYIGGGTPTALPATLLKELLDSINGYYEFNNHYEFPAGAEVTIEANPATIDTEKISLLREKNVNRVSLGVQSLNDDELAILGRLHSAQDALDSFHLIRGLGFNNVSLDLIYGIPGQKESTWRETLDKVIALGPEHISAYELMIEACTPLYVEVETGVLKMPPEQEVLKLAGLCQEKLEKAGYRRYEVSNYARPGLESRHNINYWRRGEYLGLGAGAHSFINNKRWHNTQDVLEYIESLGRGVLPVKEHETLSPDDAKREFIFLGLRMAEGISIKKGEEIYGLSLISASKHLVNQGLLEIKNGHLSATRKGFSVLNGVISDLTHTLGL
jgi:oxygen-independent coproporphyrinogen-3 oxidase